MTYLTNGTLTEDVRVLIEQNPVAQNLNSTSTTQFTTIDYTLINYKPLRYIDGTTASFVIYNASFLIQATPDAGGLANSGVSFKLVYSTDGGATFQDWGDNTVVNFGSYQRGQIKGSVFECNFCLDTAGWNENRLLKLEGLCVSTGAFNVQLHENIDFYDQNGQVVGVSSFYKPKVFCRSIK